MQCIDTKPAKYEPIAFNRQWMMHRDCGECDVKRTTPCKDCHRQDRQKLLKSVAYTV